MRHKLSIEEGNILKKLFPKTSYFLLTLQHKWCVFIEGLRVDAPIWRLIIHDWTKFMPSELPHYGRQFFGKADDPESFIQCWTKHQNRHYHHWEFWIPRTGHNRCNPPYKDNEPIPMPMWAVKEMVADWLGASWVYNGKRVVNRQEWSWLKNAYPEMKLHSTTRSRVEWCLYRLFIE